MVELVLAVYIAIPVGIVLAGAVIRIRARWFPRRRRLRAIPRHSTGPVSLSDHLYFAMHNLSSWGPGGDSGGGGSDGGGGGC